MTTPTPQTHDDLPAEAKAHDLLGPDVEPPVAPVKRIAERRVVGWELARRLLLRRARRPAGNSRRFWSRVEDDDPFLSPPAGARAAEIGGPSPAAERLVRMQGGTAVPTRAPRPSASLKPASPSRPEMSPEAPPTTAPSRPRAPRRPAGGRAPTTRRVCPAARRARALKARRARALKARRGRAFKARRAGAAASPTRTAGPIRGRRGTRVA